MLGNKVVVLIIINNNNIDHINFVLLQINLLLFKRLFIFCKFGTLFGCHDIIWLCYLNEFLIFTLYIVILKQNIVFAIMKYFANKLVIAQYGVPIIKKI